MGTDIIKEYLISLGFNVDNASFNQFSGTMNRTNESVNKFTGTINSQFAKAALSVTGFVAAANVGIFSFLETLAKADLQNQMFAKKMWMNPENARAMQTSLKALGATMQDLYYSPELLERYIRLKREAFDMQAPNGFEAEMKGIRDITFEFQRLKLEGSYALQWIGYYLIKYIDGPLSKFNFSMKDFNNMLVKTMPHWTNQIAMVLSWFVKLGEAGMDSLKTIWGWIKKLSDDTPASIKKIALALIGLTIIFNATPFGQIAFGITAIGAAINDYKVHAAGGDAVFGKFWDSLDALFKKIKADTTFETLGSDLKDILKSMGDLGQAFLDVEKDLTDFGKTGGDSLSQLKPILSVVHETLDTINDVIRTVAQGVNALNALNNGDWKGFVKAMSQPIVDSDPEVAKAVKKYDLKGNDPIGDGKKVIDAIKNYIFGAPKINSNTINKALNFNDDTKLAIQRLIPMINNNKTPSIVISPVYHITGNNPQEIGKAVATQNDKVIGRALFSVIK